MTDLVLGGFEGPGGWSTGLRMAGWTGDDLGVEIDPAACATATAAGHRRIQGDVSRFPAELFAGLVDGVTMSPPCTTFSNAGHGAGRKLIELLATAMTRTIRGENVVARTRREAAKILRPVAWQNKKLLKATRAERSAWIRRQAVTSVLVVEPARWVRDIRPRWVALEQVPSVLPLWRHLAALLPELGYRAWAGKLDAECYGVPQTRDRAILTARRDGLPVGPPEPTHQAYVKDRAPVDVPDLFGDPLPPPVSMAEALWGGIIRACQSACDRHPRHTQTGTATTASNATVAVGTHTDLRTRQSTDQSPTDSSSTTCAETVGAATQNIWSPSPTRSTSCEALGPLPKTQPKTAAQSDTATTPALTASAAAAFATASAPSRVGNAATAPTPVSEPIALPDIPTTSRTLGSDVRAAAVGKRAHVEPVTGNGPGATASGSAERAPAPSDSPLPCCNVAQARNSGPGAERDPRPLDAPSYTIRAQGSGSHPSGTEWVVCTNNNSRIGGGKTELYTRDMDVPAPTLTGNVNRWTMAPAGATSTMVEPRPVDEPGHTITGKATAAWVAGEETRRVTVQEAAILQSFPPDYPWQGNKSEQYRQVGDAMPPLLAAAILRALIQRSIARSVA